MLGWQQVGVRFESVLISDQRLFFIISVRKIVADDFSTSSEKRLFRVEVCKSAKMTANTEDSNIGGFFASTAPPENFEEKKQEIRSFIKLHEGCQMPVVLVTVSV